MSFYNGTVSKSASGLQLIAHIFQIVISARSAMSNAAAHATHGLIDLRLRHNRLPQNAADFHPAAAMAFELRYVDVQDLRDSGVRYGTDQLDTLSHQACVLRG